ncbi:MAG: 2OG-Fe(II) oxygenase [Gammaproteobacteria bacterium]|nr:2OG-Fe(II) oxygenase [Gammaproteobacteria bacterium]
MLNHELDASQLRATFQKNNRIQIPNILQPQAAEVLYDCLHKQVPWTLAYMDEDGGHTLSKTELEKLTPDDQRVLGDRIKLIAKDQFQFVYNSYMMVTAYKERRDQHLVLHSVLEYFNASEWLDFIRAITDINNVVKVDAQATRYLPGHFLKSHNDVEPAQGRLAAYVLNLTRGWKADWGGLLHFTNGSRNVVDTYVPRFNSLTIFKVPADHCVSCVAPYARRARYAITGWFMSQ